MIGEAFQTRLRRLIALFLCVQRSAFGAGELEGQIRGQVAEAATNAPVPGAVVTVTSSNLGDPRSAVTDENGEYLITNLPIGHYRLTVSYPGVKPIVREILVQPGVTSAVDVKWSAELTEAETTTVFEERPVTNPDSTQTGSIVTPEQLRYPPASNRRFTDVMLFVPGEGGGIIDKKAKVPHADEITTSLRREILRNTVAGVEHTWRRTSNIWHTVDTNVIWDPTGYRIIGYVDGIPHVTTIYTTPDEATQNYQGVSVSLEGRPTQNWYFFAAYTLSWLWGTSSDNTLFHIPQQFKFASGFLPNDNRHMIQGAGSYTVHGLTVGPRLEFFSGGPRNKFFSGVHAGSSNRRSPRGTDPGVCAGSVPGQGSFVPATTVCDNTTGLISEYREPPRVQVDLHLEYDFYEVLRQHLALNLEFLNIFNDRSATALQENDSASGLFGLVSGRNTGLIVRFGARYDF